ncbi:MAG: 23S rRNA (pseudouridine(1915)-N(3))-methyltransferase RlmH [Chromatiales bacterium]
MRIHLVTVGRRPAEWVRQGRDSYAKRFRAQLPLNLIEIPPVARRGNQPASIAMRKEGERVRAAIPSGARIVALDEHGRQWSSAELAAQLERWRREGCEVAMIVGGADGLDRSLMDAADRVWSLSRLTLPHALIPVIVVEQLYRAWSLLNNHPYHRA